MKFKTIKVSTTKDIANRSGNRIAKQKLKEAAKDLNDVLKTAPEEFVKIHLPEQKPSSIVKYLHAAKPNTRRSFKNRKLIASTPHINNNALSNTNRRTNDFSNAGSSISNICEESVARINLPPPTDKQIELDDSDSEIDEPKFRNGKRTNCEPAPNCFPNKKRDPIDRIDTSSNIIFVDSDEDSQLSRAKAKSRIKRKTKKQTTVKKTNISMLSNQSPSPRRAELLIPSENVLSPPRDFVNKTPRSTGRVNFTNLRDDSDKDAWAKSFGLLPVSPQGTDLIPSPRKKYDLRSSGVDTEKAQTSSHNVGQPVARNLFNDLQAEKSPIDIQTKIQEDKNNKSSLKQAKGNSKHPQEAAIESKSDDRPIRKKKGPKATKKSVQSVGSSPKLKIIENIILKAKEDNVNNSPKQNSVHTNDEIVQTQSNNESDGLRFNLIEEIESRKLKLLMPAAPPPLKETDPISVDDFGNKDMTTKDPNMNAEPSTSGIHLQMNTQETNQKRGEVRKSLWNYIFHELDSYADRVTQKGEHVASDSSSISRESGELFSEMTSTRKSASNKQKMQNLKNTLKKLPSVKKNSNLVDRQIQTERLFAPIFRQSIVSRNKKSKSRIFNTSDKSPNIYDSLEQGNAIDALGFSNFDEPTLSFKHKPFRFDTPSRSIGRLSWSNSNIYPNFSGDSDDSFTMENNLSPKPHNPVKSYCKNKTVASTNRRKSKLVQPNQIFSSSDSSVSNTANASPRPRTRYVARINDTNKRNSSKSPTIVLTPNKSSNQIQETTESQANASEKRHNKSAHYDMILHDTALKSPQHKSSNPKHPTLEPPQFSRQDVRIMLNIKNLPSPRNLSFEKQQELDDENSKSKRQQNKSISKLNPLAEPFQSLMDNDEISRTKQDDVSNKLTNEVLSVRKQKDPKQDSILVGVGNNLANSFMGEVLESSGKQKKQATFEQVAVSDLSNNEVPGSSDKSKKQLPQNSTLEQVNASNDLRNVADSSDKSRKQQKTPKQPPQTLTLEQINGSVIRNDEVFENSRTRSKSRKQRTRSNSKHYQSVNESIRDNEAPENSRNSSRTREQHTQSNSRHYQSLHDNVNAISNVDIHIDNEAPENSGTSSKIRKQRSQSNSKHYQSLHDNVDPMSNEAPENSGTSLRLQNKSSTQNSTLKPLGVRNRSDSCSTSNQETQPLEDEIQNSVPTKSTRGRKKKNQAPKDETENNNNATKKPKIGKKKNELSHINESPILPEQDGRRQLRVRKPPIYCPIIDLATSIKSYAWDPALLKKLKKNSTAAKIVTSFTASQPQKGRGSRLTNQMPTVQESSRVEPPVESEIQLPQDDQPNVSDSVLMPPPSTNFLRPRNCEDSDSGFASISVKKKAPGKTGLGGKRSTRRTKTIKEVPEPCSSSSIEPPTTDSVQGPAQTSSYMNETESRSATNSQNPEEADSLYQTVDGKVFKTQFVCSEPSHLNYTSVGNLFVNEITKVPNNQYTVGYLRIGQGESKKVAKSTKFSFVYVVVTGAAEVTVESKICIVNQGGYFWVPVGTTYSIKNTSLDLYLEINFTRIRAGADNQ
ncbi:unnamed protein product [Ceutorhynchus assimilis]|uniref:Mif2/CENP-C cupin domain-containing protein n=1 Tax=Ceutorhynchus assimilis TaxID=467358 RepID=A0A9N9MDI3_9CUCU|nr:unnamed protein product [Ceutorhynchus assimilis]